MKYGHAFLPAPCTAAPPPKEPRIGSGWRTEPSEKREID